MHSSWQLPSVKAVVPIAQNTRFGINSQAGESDEKWIKVKEKANELKGEDMLSYN
jgi:hypothetical protein